MKLYNELGFCQYKDHLGSDWRVCEAARISFGKDALKGIEQDTKLIRYLMANRHTSPFEQCNITFRIRMPIFVMRHFVRHRTFRLNEESARYHPMKDDMYIPKEWRIQDKKNKQGSINSKLDHKKLAEIAEESCVASYTAYQILMAEGVASEMARLVLPVNLMTKIVVNIDLHNLMHFFVLRLHEHAQYEIRQLASAMYVYASNHFPVIISAFKNLVLDRKGIKPIPKNEINS